MQLLDDTDYYIVFYVVNEEAKIVEIHRVLWGGMDLPNRLKEE